MRIGLCEDHAPDLLRLRRSVERYLAERGLVAELAAFDRPGEFLAHLGRAGVPEISFLDIYMGEMTGVELARRIREADSRAAIIFVTGSAEHMSDGYEVGATHYLLKPVQDDQLERAMDRALLFVGEPGGALSFTEDHRPQRIPHSEILYLEVRDKHCYIFTVDGGEHVTAATLAAMTEQLTDPRFLDCHRSFIVNMDHIRRVAKDDFIMKTGQLVPIRTRPRAGTLAQYEAYRFKRIRRA